MIPGEILSQKNQTLLRKSTPSTLMASPSTVKVVSSMRCVKSPKKFKPISWHAKKSISIPLNRLYEASFTKPCENPGNDRVFPWEEHQQLLFICTNRGEQCWHQSTTLQGEWYHQQQINGDAGSVKPYDVSRTANSPSFQRTKSAQKRQVQEKPQPQRNNEVSYSKLKIRLPTRALRSFEIYAFIYNMPSSRRRHPDYRRL